jgi:hypothetical protein
VYNRLQRAYEVHTYLAEVAAVVFVAEPIPVVDAAWVKQHDWILAKVLLDESFREPLDWLSKAGGADDSSSSTDSDGPDVKLGLFLDQAKTSVAQIAAVHGTISNVYDAAVQAYGAAKADAVARAHEAKARSAQVQRLLAHIKDNLLHYCRAVWSSEDPDARMLRYTSIYVPAKVTWAPPAQPSSGEAGATPAVVIPPHVAPAEPRSPSLPLVSNAGVWRIGTGAQEVVPLSDVVNPAGPIGFFGNYAVFHVRNGAIAGMNEALTYHRLKYAEPSTLFVSARPTNAGGATVVGEITRALVLTYHPFQLAFLEDDGQLRFVLTVELRTNGQLLTKTIGEGRYVSGLVLDFTGDWGFRLTITEASPGGPPRAGDAFTIIAANPKLCDPELGILREQHPIPNDDEGRRAFFDDALLDDLVELMPGLRQALAPAPPPSPEAGTGSAAITWDALTAKQRAHVVSVYHLFLLRHEHTRRFLVDTNSVVMNVLTGSGSTLEPFAPTPRRDEGGNRGGASQRSHRERTVRRS